MLYFAEIGDEARELFLRLGRKKNCAIDTRTYSYGLSTDVAVVDNRAIKWLVVASGLHGGEGYTGSALQAFCLDTIVDHFPEWNFRFIHAINPYGMRHFQRENINNVDLNRSIQLGEFMPLENEDYKALHYLMNSTYSARDMLRLTGLILKYLFTKKKIILGQSDSPEGLFYSGKEEQEEVTYLKEIISHFPEEQTIVYIDIHTGFGVAGFPICETAIDQDSLEFKILSDIIGKKLTSTTGNGFPYAVRGDINTYLAHQGKNVIDLLMEFGTKNGLLVKTYIESFRTMRAHNLDKRRESRSKKITSDYRKLFYPSSRIWRKDVVKHFDRIVRGILNRF